MRAKLGLAEWKPNGRGNGTDHAARQQARGSGVRLHDYTDRLGGLLYQKLRYDPKDFRVRRRDGNGGWTGLHGVPRVLYRLPELSEAVAQDHPIYIAESEKAVDALVSAGVVATKVWAAPTVGTTVSPKT